MREGGRKSREKKEGKVDQRWGEERRIESRRRRRKRRKRRMRRIERRKRVKERGEQGREEIKRERGG